jgi:glucoamylase
MDGASIIALNVGYADDEYFSPVDKKVAATVATYNNMFCNEYAINQADDKAGIPGIFYGRYKGDSYGGGNPWILSTGDLADLFYRGALFSLQKEGFTLTQEDHAEWSKVFPNLKATASATEFASTLASAGDAVMERLYAHVKDDGNHLAE